MTRVRVAAIKTSIVTTWNTFALVYRIHRKSTCMANLQQTLSASSDSANPRQNVQHM